MATNVKYFIGAEAGYMKAHSKISGIDRSLVLEKYNQWFASKFSHKYSKNTAQFGVRVGAEFYDIHRLYLAYAYQIGAKENGGKSGYHDVYGYVIYKDVKNKETIIKFI